jgi:sugar lactone lactonase YvrE
VTVELAFDVRAELGEGPLWDAARERLLLVDIMRGHVHEWDPVSGDDAIFDAGQPVSAVATTAGSDLILAVRDGFIRLNRTTGATTLVAIVEADRDDNRMNDGYCDAEGRFWAGTMSMVHEREAGGLYRLDPNGAVTQHLSGVSRWPLALLRRHGHGPDRRV